MKSPAEVIGEMMLAGLRSKTQEERVKVMDDLFGMIAQITLPNLTEALVLFFEEMEVDGERKKWLRYQSYPTPWVRCEKCGWTGFYGELPVKEEKIEIKGKAADSILGVPTKKTVQIECPICQGKNLKYKDWVHPHAKVVIYGSHWSIGAMGDIMVGPIGHRLKGLLNAMKLMIKGEIAMKPISQIMEAMKVAKLMM